MWSGLRIIALALGSFALQAAIAQAPAGAPTGSTGQCKDGTYTSTATKKGACRGHQGVKEWFAASAPAAAPSAPAAAPSAPPAPAPAPAPAAATPSARTTTHASTATPAGTPAPGGGPGLVWLNTSSNVYHCYGTRYYGTTKAGKYVTEAQAKAAGAHGERGKACSQ